MPFPKYHIAGIGLIALGFFALLGEAFLFFQEPIQFKNLAASTLPEPVLQPTPLLPVPTPIPTPAYTPLPMPSPLKGLYLTSYSASSPRMIQSMISLARKGEINAVVIDIKDYSGYVAYRTNVPEAKKYHAEKNIISDPKALISSLHKENIYVIARMVVFQDPVLAKGRPDLAVHSKTKMQENLPLSSSTIWKDNHNLSWIDPASHDAWEYIALLSLDAKNQGFDEINFDYVRFPSDGNLKDMVFPLWDGKTPRHEIIKEFLEYEKSKLADVTLSVDFFGLSTISRDDLGVGQIIEDAYSTVDVISPMVYPSHYAKGFSGYENPAEYPYEVVKRSLDSANARLERMLKKQEETKKIPVVRPWLQDFDLGAEYGEREVRGQIEAAKESFGKAYSGFMLWNPSNVYTKSALLPKVCFGETCFEAELAKTPEQRTQGLMFRKQLDEGKGMLFVFEEPGLYAFWMKNMNFPIDILWIEENKVVHIEEHVQPCVQEECPSFTPSHKAAYVLELPVGSVGGLGITEGDKVILP